MGRARLNLTEQERKLRIKAQKKKSDAKRWREKTEYRERQLVLAKKRREEEYTEIRIARILGISIHKARILTGKFKVPHSHFGRSNFENNSS